MIVQIALKHIVRMDNLGGFTRGMAVTVQMQRVFGREFLLHILFFQVLQPHGIGCVARWSLVSTAINFRRSGIANPAHIGHFVGSPKIRAGAAFGLGNVGAQSPVERSTSHAEKDSQIDTAPNGTTSLLAAVCTDRVGALKPQMVEFVDGDLVSFFNFRFGIASSEPGGPHFDTHGSNWWFDLLVLAEML